MKNRLWYALGFATAVGLKVLIGLYVHDRFVRPYVGDVIVVVALYLLARLLWPGSGPWLPLWVFLFAAAVEGLQGLGWAELPVVRESRLLRVALGSTFDWADIACYAAGCGGVAIVRRIYKCVRK